MTTLYRIGIRLYRVLFMPAYVMGRAPLPPDQTPPQPFPPQPASPRPMYRSGAAAPRTTFRR